MRLRKQENAKRRSEMNDERKGEWKYNSISNFYYHSCNLIRRKDWGKLNDSSFCITRSENIFMEFG
jgi:hypothetical protein